MNILCSVSGGSTSAMMAYVIKNSIKYKNDNIVYAFANTSRESPETIQFLLDIMKYWNIKIYFIEGVYSLKLGKGVGHRIVHPDKLQMQGLIYYKSILHKNKGVFSGLPFQFAPYCSEMLKVLPLRSFAKEYFKGKPYVTAIGFRAEDMPKRISFPEIKEIKNKIYPLITDFQKPINLIDVYKFFETQPFKLNLDKKRGNCLICWKKPENVLLQILKNDDFSSIFEKKLELKFGNTSYRNNKSIIDLVNTSKRLPTQLNLFSNENINDLCMCNF
jgi:hypothetical protein